MSDPIQNVMAQLGTEAFPVSQYERKFEELAESLPGMVYQVATDGSGNVRHTYCSRNSIALTGLTPEEILTDPLALTKQVLPEDLHITFNAYVGSMQTLKPFVCNFRIRHLDGGVRHLRSYATPKRTEVGCLWNGYTVDVTGEVEARARTEAAERRLKEITDSLPGTLFQNSVDSHGKIELTYVSGGIVDLWGVDPVKAKDLTAEVFACVVPEDRDRVRGGIRSQGKSEAEAPIDFRIRHAKTGEIRWLRTLAATVVMPDGSILRNGYWQDITDIKALQEALHEALLAAETAERNVRDIAESLPGVVYRMVFEGANPTRFTDMTDGALAVYGVPREAILKDGDIFRRCLHPQDRDRMNIEFMNAMREKRSAQTDFRFNRPDGRTVWLRTYAAPRLLPNGVAWVGYTTDVTVEREAQERADTFLRQLTEARDQAQAAEQRLRAIFDHTKIGLVMIDANKNFSNANPSLRELLVIEDEQEFARDFPSFSPPFQPDGRPSMEKAAEVIETAFSTGYHRFDWQHQTRGGEPRPCEIALTRITLGGQPHIFATMTDLRDRKRAEAALEKASSEAQAAARTKGEFLANMSHEIRTPMNAIIGLSHLGLRARDLEHSRDYLSKIQASAQSLLQILNDILDVSKIEAGKLSLESIGFDLYEVLDNLSGMLSVRAAEKGLELLFDVDPSVPAALVGDPLRLGQILLNLTGNAIKFTDAGQIVVRVALGKQGRDFARLKFEIRDTGIGMTADQVARLFQAFAQADTSTTRRYGGTGLGLTIVKRLVEMMDGDIVVQSASGEGSTFRFDVRLGLGSASAARPRIVPDRLRDLRVLVADDNPTAVEILSGTLESFGFRVAVARDGAEAVARIRGARNDPFGLVLMDWQMPRMNGIEASRKIRELGPPQPPMIIMVTAFGREEVERQAEDARLDGFLVKPVNPSLLFDAILEAFGEGTVTRREESHPVPIDGERLRGLRVLVAEDNEINQQVARELLEAVGVEVTIAENGVQAVQRLNTQVFDVVLMDLQMPEMDGIEATKRIRGEGGLLARIPIIAMTANAMAEDRDRCLDAGMDDHIGKPVDVVQLYDVLARYAAVTAEAAGEAPAPAAASLAASQRNDADEPPFNFPLAIQRLGGSRPIFEKLAGRFVKSPENAAMIETMVQSGDTAGARRVIHTLKGVAASLGAMRLAKAAADAEKAASAGIFDRATLEELGELEREARDVLGQAATVG